MARLSSILVVVLALFNPVDGFAVVENASSYAGPMVQLPGHVLEALANATKVTGVSTAKALGPLTTASDAAELSLTLVLKRDDEEGFQSYLHDVYDPASPSFRQFMTQAQIAERFGPSQEAYDQVLAYLRTQNFELTEGSVNRLTMTMRAARTDAERAFTVHLADYELRGRTFHANDSDPSLPEPIAAHVQAVVGLSNLAQPLGSPPLQVVVQALYCQVVVSLYLIAVDLGEFGTAYGMTLAQLQALAAEQAARRKKALNKCLTLAWNSYKKIDTKDPPPPAWQGADGTGQTIGLIEFDTFNLSDVADYINLISLPTAKIADVTKVHINGGAGATPGPHQDEVLLDIDNVLTIAPGAKIVVYDAPATGSSTSFQAVFNAAIGDGVNIISNSWSYCEDQTTLADVLSLDSVLQTAAAAGIGVFNGSGDTGSTCSDGAANTIGVPAGSPHATAVGGTSLTTGPGYSYGSETWWDGSASSPATGQGGYGVSKFFARPAYQDGINANAKRSIPDVALRADPSDGIMICAASLGGCPTGAAYGGTSSSAPAWAAFAALLNQSQGTNLGSLNPQLYPLANSSAFHTGASMGSDFAHVGLGSTDFSQLHQMLTGQTAGAASATVSQLEGFSTANSTLGLDSTSPMFIAADGTSAGSIVVRLTDANGNTVSGKTVVLSASPGSHAIITPASAVTDPVNGAVTFSITDLFTEIVTFTATDTTDGVTLLQTTQIGFVTPPAAAGGIQVSSPSVAADGTGQSTITVTLQDALARPTPFKLVTLSQTGHSVITGPTPSRTNAAGQIQFTVTNTVQEVVTYTAVDFSDHDLAVPGSGQVTFSAGGGDNCGSTNFGNPDITAGDGYAITPYATGFLPKNTSFGSINYGCRGVSGLAFDPSGNLFVSDMHDGNIYKFAPGGGVAAAGTLITAVPLGPGIEALTFGLDGKLYAAKSATTGNFFTGAVMEISPVNGTVVRTVASSITCASFLVTDPLSGDLFVDDSCAGAGSDNGSIWRISNPGGPTPTTSVYKATPGVNGGLTFSSGGTLYVIDYTENGVASIGGTNTAQPAVKTLLPGLHQAALDIVALGSQPNGDAKTLVMGMPADTFGFPAGIKAIDLTTNPVTAFSMLVNNAFASVNILGPDGCLYASMHVAVYKITNADGSCPLVLGAPSLSLGPSVVSPSPAQGTIKNFTATFHYTSVPAGTSVLFVVSGANTLEKLARTDANGNATFSYQGVNAGSDTVIATADVGSSTLTSNLSRVKWLTGLHTTSLDLNLSPGTGAVGANSTLKASLFDVSVSPVAAIVGASIHFTLGSQVCNAVTDSSGIASCNLVLSTAGNLSLTASFAGDAQYLPASASAGFNAVVVPTCDLDVDGDGTIQPFKDGILFVRYMLGNRGASLLQGLTLTGSRTDSNSIETFIAAQNYNVDAGTTATQPFVDGIILVRLMLGVPDATLLTGITIPAGAAFTTAPAIRANVNTLCGTSF